MLIQKSATHRLQKVHMLRESNNIAVFAIPRQDFTGDMKYSFILQPAIKHHLKHNLEPAYIGKLAQGAVQPCISCTKNVMFSAGINDRQRQRGQTGSPQQLPGGYLQLHQSCPLPPSAWPVAWSGERALSPQISACHHRNMNECGMCQFKFGCSSKS